MDKHVELYLFFCVESIWFKIYLFLSGKKLIITKTKSSDVIKAVYVSLKDSFVVN